MPTRGTNVVIVCHSLPALGDQFLISCRTLTLIGRLVIRRGPPHLSTSDLALRIRSCVAEDGLDCRVILWLVRAWKPRHFSAPMQLLSLARILPLA